MKKIIINVYDYINVLNGFNLDELDCIIKTFKLFESKGIKVEIRKGLNLK